MLVVLLCGRLPGPGGGSPHFCGDLWLDFSASPRGERPRRFRQPQAWHQLISGGSRTQSPVSLQLGPLCPGVASRALPLTGPSQPLLLVIFTPDTSQWIPERDSAGFSRHLCSGLGLAALSSVVWTGDDDGRRLPVVFVL